MKDFGGAELRTRGNHRDFPFQAGAVATPRSKTGQRPSRSPNTKYPPGGHEAQARERLR